jgi:DNA-binding SARP family transcriptional activator
VWIDADAFERAAAEARSLNGVDAYRSARALYRGEVLPEDRYEQWPIGRRDALHRDYLGLLTDLASLYESQGAEALAIDILQQLVTADAGREEAHRSLMRLYAATGTRQQALRQYQWGPPQSRGT